MGPPPRFPQVPPEATAPLPIAPCVPAPAALAPPNSAVQAATATLPITKLHLIDPPADLGRVQCSARVVAMMVIVTTHKGIKKRAMR